MELYYVAVDHSTLNSSRNRTKLHPRRQRPETAIFRGGHNGRPQGETTGYYTDSGSGSPATAPGDYKGRPQRETTGYYTDSGSGSPATGTGGHRGRPQGETTRGDHKRRPQATTRIQAPVTHSPALEKLYRTLKLYQLFWECMTSSGVSQY